MHSLPLANTHLQYPPHCSSSVPVIVAFWFSFEHPQMKDVFVPELVLYTLSLYQSKLLLSVVCQLCVCLVSCYNGPNPNLTDVCNRGGAVSNTCMMSSLTLA